MTRTLQEMLDTRNAHMKHQEEWIHRFWKEMRENKEERKEQENFLLSIKGAEDEDALRKEIDEFVKWWAKDDEYEKSWRKHITLLKEQAWDLEGRIDALNKEEEERS